MPAAYRVALAELGTAGLGNVIIPDVFGTVGAPDEDSQPLRITKTLNGPGGIELALPPFAPEVTEGAFEEGARELHVYKNDQLRWAGRLWKSAPESRGLVRFYGQGFYSTLRKREITDKKLYLPNDPATGDPIIGSDQVNIAWNLISYTQGKPGGDLGITRNGTDGSNATGIRRHAAYCKWECRKVADAIEELAGAFDGFDHEVGADKVWRTWHPRRGAVRTAVLDAASNVQELGFSRDAFEATVSEFRGLGPCEQCDGNTDIKVSSDAGALAKYGLLQDSEHWPVKDGDHLQALADEQVRVRKGALSQPTVMVPTVPGGPEWGVDYGIGDTVTIQASEGFTTFSGQYRVLSIDVKVGTGDDEEVTVTADSAIG